MVTDGRLSAASAALISESIAEPTEENLKKLLEKHPSQASPEDIPLPDAVEPIWIPKNIVYKNLRSFPKGSAPGPTGTRASHILNAVQIHNQTDALEVLTAFVNHISSGKVPSEIQPFLAGAFLIGIGKKDGGIRPIAIGDIYRRLTSKCLSSLILNEANEYFLPFQCVCAQGGAEAVVHAWRSLMDEFKIDPLSEESFDFDAIGFKTDFINAFNSVQRNIFLQKCAQKFPQIYKWVYFCYSQHSLLFFGDHAISSEAGVQQGDPLGPFLFCLVLQKLVLKISDQVPNLRLHSWYMDDGSFFGDSRDVLKAWNIVKDEGPALGLFPNVSKCELISPSFSSSALHKFEPELKKEAMNMEILGSPIGSKEFCESFLQDKINKKLPILLENLTRLDNPQASYLILLFCASFCKIVWYIRTVPSDLIAVNCQNFDDLILKTFEGILACGFSSQTVKQMQLSTKFGGIGLRSARNHASAGYISSFFSSKSLAQSFLQTPIFNPHIESCLSSLNCTLPEEDRVEFSSEPLQQKTLSAKIDRAISTQLSAECSLIDKARILCCSAPHASSWIRALPTSLNKFSNLEWVIAMKRWLGIPIYNEEHMCVACHKQIMDIHGHHAAVCPVSGDRVKRHNALRDCFHEFCSNAAWGPVKEKPFLLPFSSERPADIFVPNFSGGKGLVVDFACTCPIQQKYVRPASQTVSFTCNKYAQEAKYDIYESRVKSEGHLYLPIVFESFGGMSDDAVDFVKKMLQSVSTRINENKVLVSKLFYEQISCILMRSIAKSLISRFPDFSMA